MKNNVIRQSFHFLFVNSTFIALAVCLPQPSVAFDETESLALLVEMLDDTEDSDVRLALMKGMLSGLEGRRDVEAPKGWTELSKELAASEDKNVREFSSRLSQIFGDRTATLKALATLRDKNADNVARKSALLSLLNQQNRDVSDMLESLLDEPALALNAIRGYAVIENPTAPAVLLDRYGGMNPELRRAVIETLATRKSYALNLLEAIKTEKVSRDEVPPHVARSLEIILGDPFVEVFGEVKSIAADREMAMEKYRKLLTPQAIADGDASRGRAVFDRSCATCHLLYGEGGEIGPDLTGSNRANLDYILLNSVDPSYDVPDAYKLVNIETIDGRVISGVLGEEDATRVVLKTALEPRVVILKEDIEDRYILPQSMMPDGQLDKMKTQEVIDLIKYLKTTEQVEIAK